MHGTAQPKHHRATLYDFANDQEARLSLPCRDGVTQVEMPIPGRRSAVFRRKSTRDTRRRNFASEPHEASTIPAGPPTPLNAIAKPPARNTVRPVRGYRDGTWHHFAIYPPTANVKRNLDQIGSLAMDREHPLPVRLSGNRSGQGLSGPKMHKSFLRERQGRGHAKAGGPLGKKGRIRGDPNSAFMQVFQPAPIHTRQNGHTHCAKRLSERGHRDQAH